MAGEEHKAVYRRFVEEVVNGGNFDIMAASMHPITWTMLRLPARQAAQPASGPSWACSARLSPTFTSPSS